MKPLLPISANPENAILMIVDLEKTSSLTGKQPLPPPFVEPHPELCTLKAIVPTVASLLAGARAAGVPVVYVQSVRNNQEYHVTAFGGAPSGMKLGTEGAEFFDEITPAPRDYVVRKWDHDPWFETDLERVLVALVPDPTKCQVLVTGGSIMGCALYGILGLYVRNYRTMVVMDAVYGGPVVGGTFLSRTAYPDYPNIYLTRSDLITFSPERAPLQEPALATAR